jgi:glycosyltransferase involved in cell wall biosynthesis
VPPHVDVFLAGDNAPGVAAGLVERLSACARREPSAATVSVISDAGPVAYDAPIADGALDALFASQNAGVHIDVPCALPPRVYVTERALRECGAPASWTPEALVDFCTRASQAGFRHLLAADAYAPADAAQVETWQAAIDANEPLRAEWAEFARRAPAIPPHRRVDVARLRASPRPRVLFVTHHWGGGVEAHINDLATLLADDCELLVLRPGVAGSIHVRWLRPGESLEAWFDAASEWDECRAFLASLGLSRVHIHHVHGLPREALDLANSLGIPCDVTLHDHYAICPQYHLADPQGVYCGEPDDNGCNACIAARPAQWPLDIQGWRALFHRVLREAERVIAPSTDLAARVQRYHPDVKIQVLPHPELREDPPRVYKVLLLGGLSAIKGMELFERCAHDAVERDLPLRFHVLGHLSRPLRDRDALPVTIDGSYEDRQLAEQVALEHPDAFLFLSQVPESYSYTLSVALRTGKPIVATQLGAFVERLRGYPHAGLVPHDSSPKHVNDTLLRLVRGRPEAHVPRAVPIWVHRA